MLLRDNVHPQLEACLLSNPDHTFTQSQTLKLYRRLGGRFDCRYFAISCRLSAGSPPCVCYCATTYTLNWRRACFQTRTTRSPNHRHSSCINDLEAALTADILPFPAGFPPAFRRFSALRVLLRDNVHPQLEARLLSNPDHTCIQSQTLKLYQRLGDYFDWRFSTGSLLFLTGSLAGFSTLLRPFFCCAAAATHRFSLLFLTIFLLVPGSSATYPPLSAVFAAIFPGSSAGSPPCVCYCATTYTLNWRRACFQTRTTRAPNHRHSSCINDLEAALTAVFPQVRCYFSPVLSPVSPRCCGHFFVAPQQPPTNFRCYFLPFSYWFPVLPPGSCAGYPPCVCYCATTYTLNWRRACFQTRTTRASNHRHSSCIDDLEAALTADILPFPAGFPPAFRRFSALRVLLRDNVHPQLEARLLSNPDHTCIQSQTLKLYQRLGDYFDCQFSAHFPGSSSFLLGFLPVLRRFLSCSCPVYTLNRRRACFKLGTHVHPITDTQAVSTTWRLF